MKLLLSDEEIETLVRLSNKKELNIINAGYNNYFGVDREKNKEDIKVLNTIIRKVLPSLNNFSNFTGETPNRIRVQSDYNYGTDNLPFSGVFYMTVDEVITAKESE